MRLKFSTVALAVLILLIAVPAFAQGGESAVQQMYNALKEKCWSCEFYGQIVNGTNQVFTGMYQWFNGLTKFMSFIALCVAIVLIWKIIWFFSPILRQEYELVHKWEEIVGLFLRTTVVFICFLSAAGLQAAQQNSSGDKINHVRDFFFDGPMAVGTSVGCDFIQKAQSAVSTVPGASQYGSVSCQPIQNSTNWLSNHVENAKQILTMFHNLGVGGIALAMRTGEAGMSNGAQDKASQIVLALVAVPLTMMFIGWTFVFGLRYCDVALRALVSLSLFPIFMALWIFDKTRPIAHMALKSVLFMMALFAVSGISFVMAAAILQLGFTLSGSGAGPSGGGSLACQDAANGFYPCIYSIAITVGCWGAAIGIAGMSFKLAEEFVSYEGGYSAEMGVGQQAGGQLAGAASGAVGKTRAMI